MDKNRHGVSLIEVLFVLGIMAILIGMIMVVYSNVTINQKSNQMIEEFLTIINDAQSLTSGFPDFQNIDSKTLIQSGLLPQKYISGDKIITPFGSEIEIYVYGPGNTADSVGKLAVYFLDLPQVPCIMLATKAVGQLADGYNVNWNWTNGMSNGNGLTPSQASQACESGDNWIGINVGKSG